MNSSPEDIIPSPTSKQLLSPKEALILTHFSKRLQQLAETVETTMRDMTKTVEELKSIFAVFGIQANGIGHQVTEMKGISKILEQTLQNAGLTSLATTEVNVVPVQDDSNLAGLITPPGTPARQGTSLSLDILNGNPDKFMRDHESSAEMPRPPPVGILGKRRSPESEASAHDKVDGNSDAPNTKKCKHVRFADLEDIPISHLRTPDQQLSLRSESSDLVLPVPQFLFTFPRRGNTNSQQISSEGSQSRTTTTLSPPSSPIILPPTARKARSKYQDSPLVLRVSKYPRQKTRWNPQTGKRVPVNSGGTEMIGKKDRRTSSPTITTAVEDYERRLSHGLSNASIE